MSGESIVGWCQPAREGRVGLWRKREAAGAGQRDTVRSVGVVVERRQANRGEAAERGWQRRAELASLVCQRPPEGRALSSRRQQQDAVARMEAAAAERFRAEEDRGPLCPVLRRDGRKRAGSIRVGGVTRAGGGLLDFGRERTHRGP